MASSDVLDAATGAYPRVAVIVLNWNGCADTLECVGSLLKLDYPRYEVIVVDNGSVDDSVPKIRSAYPNVRIIETGANLGYAGGNNVGLRSALNAGFDYALVLNNDTTVDRGLLRAMLETHGAATDIGIVGAQILYYSQPDTIWTSTATWSERTLSFVRPERGKKFGPNDEMFLETDIVIGCCMLVSSNTIRLLGDLDERFFLNYEETDWCYRARAAGLRCVIATRAVIWHKVSASFGGETPLWHYFLSRNRLLWSEMHLSPPVRRQVASDALATLGRDFLPRLTKGDQFWLKRLYWSLPEWKRRVRDEALLLNMAGYALGLLHYVVRRFGDADRLVRYLDRRARTQLRKAA